MEQLGAWSLLLTRIKHGVTTRKLRGHDPFFGCHGESRYLVWRALFGLLGLDHGVKDLCLKGQGDWRCVVFKGAPLLVGVELKRETDRTILWMVAKSVSHHPRNPRMMIPLEIPTCFQSGAGVRPSTVGIRLAKKNGPGKCNQAPLNQWHLVLTAGT